MNKLINLLLPLLFLCPAISWCQEIHSSAEMFQIMEKSKLMYEIAMLENEIELPDRSENINLNNSYQKIVDGKITPTKYKPGKGTIKMLADAEKLFSAGEYEGALKNYKEVYASDRTFYKMLTYMGQMHGTLKRWGKAEEFYKKAIEKNYIDYLAHWFLADVYLQTNRKKDAVKEITIAKVLNRNNPRLDVLFNKIYKKNKLMTPDWIFNPQYKIDSTGPTNVKIQIETDWMAYGLTKAIWKYEPGYKESMGQAASSYSLLEEKECLIGVLVALDKKKTKKISSPELKVLKRAFEKKLLTEYIIYEIMLPDYPRIAYQLPQSLLESIADYVVDVRAKKK